MLLDIFRKKQSWFIKGILIVVAVTFVLGFGFSYSRFGSGNRVSQHSAAEVNGEGISLLEFYRAKDRLRRQYQQSGAPEEALNYNFIGIAALDQLINLKLLSQKAKELGFRVTDRELSESIRSNPAFQADGQFIGAQGYRNLVEQGLNESVADFEKGYREELLAQKLVNFIFETAEVTDEELFNIYKMQNEKVNLYFLSFSPQDFKDSFPVSEGDVKNYYENHRGEFKTPELRRIRYIALGPENFENKVGVSEEEIKAYYEGHTDKFKSEEKETRPLSEVRDEIRADIKKQGGEALLGEFAQNLKEILHRESLDEIAKENGLRGVNETGPFSADVKLPEIPPQVVEKAFSIKRGESAFSRIGGKIYVIQVSEIIPSREKTLKEAEGEIRERLSDAKAKGIAEARANEVLKKVETGGESLEKVAKSLGLNLEETGYFSRLETVPKINSDVREPFAPNQLEGQDRPQSNDEVKWDAFLLTDKTPTTSKVYRVGDRFYIVSLKEKQEADPKRFEEQKAKMKENELSQRRNRLLSDWVRELRQKSKIAVNQNLISPQG